MSWGMPLADTRRRGRMYRRTTAGRRRRERAGSVRGLAAGIWSRHLVSRTRTGPSRCGNRRISLGSRPGSGASSCGRGSWPMHSVQRGRQSRGPWDVGHATAATGICAAGISARVCAGRGSSGGAGYVPPNAPPGGRRPPPDMELERARREPIGAIVLILLGMLFLFNTMGFFNFGWVSHGWPLIIVGIAVWLLMRNTRHPGSMGARGRRRRWVALRGILRHPGGPSEPPAGGTR